MLKHRVPNSNISPSKKYIENKIIDIVRAVGSDKASALVESKVRASRESLKVECKWR